MRPIENTGQIDVDDLLPLVDREIFDERRELDACIVNQDIDAAELRFRVLDHFFNIFRFADVTAKENTFHAIAIFKIGALFFNRIWLHRTR